jgi:hypothetical protein
MRRLGEKEKKMSSFELGRWTGTILTWVSLWVLLLAPFAIVSMRKGSYWSLTIAFAVSVVLAWLLSSGQHDGVKGIALVFAWCIWAAAVWRPWRRKVGIVGKKLPIPAVGRRTGFADNKSGRPRDAAD